MKFPIFCAAGAVVLLALAGCNRGGGGSSSTVATVGKDTITEKEFFDYLQRKPAFTTVVQNQLVSVQVTDSPGYQALKDLIIDKMVLQLAKEQNVYPSDKDVSDELEFQRQQNPRLIEGALAKGMTLDDVKNEVRQELARYNLQVKGVNETTADATAFIKGNPSKFMDPPLAQCQVVVVKSADRDKVDHALSSGSPFATVAKQYTMDKDAEKNDFRYSTIDETKMPKPIRDLVDKTDELKTTPWKAIDAKGTVFFKMYVVKKTPPKPATITPVITERIRRLLAQQKGQKAGIDVNKEIAGKIQALKDQVKINIKTDDGPWKGFVDKVSSDLAKTTGAGLLGNPVEPPTGAAPGTAAAPSTGTAPATPTAPATTGGAPAPAAKK